MARYFFHLRDGSDVLLDPDGVEFGTLDLMRAAVLHNARSVMAEDVGHGVLDLRFHIEVEDESGSIVYRLPFKHAVSIIPEAQ